MCRVGNTRRKLAQTGTNWTFIRYFTSFFSSFQTAYVFLLLFIFFFALCNLFSCLMYGVFVFGLLLLWLHQSGGGLPFGFLHSLICGHLLASIFLSGVDVSLGLLEGLAPRLEPLNLLWVAVSTPTSIFFCKW